MPHDETLTAAKADAPTLHRAKGRYYYDVLADLHAVHRPDWYLEIGTQTGRSLALSTARSVSVDPEFVIKTEVVANKPELHLVQSTSDDFFADGLLDRLGARFDLAFLDGMHLYEFLLRDFINTEAVMNPDGVIVLHDCLPWEEGMAERDRSRANTRAWTGDVWKVVPILQRYRPDLTVTVLDAAPTGLVTITGLDPSSTVLRDAYDEITAAWDVRDDMREQVGSFVVTPVVDAPALRVPATASVTARRPITLKTSVRSEAKKENWGDYHFAEGLAAALRREGHATDLRTMENWDAPSDDGAFDLVLRGRAEARVADAAGQMLWFVSGQPEGEEIEAADHVFVASHPLAGRWGRRLGPGKVSLLPQAFDADRMHCPPPDAARSGIVFVGLARNGNRPMVAHALKSETEVQIWGDDWTETPAASMVVANRLDNRDLGACYAGAEIVLNDHTTWMCRRGLASNRIFDALACGTPVISDPVAWLPEDMAPFVHLVDSPRAFRAAVADIRAEGPDRRAERADFAERMRLRHSFDARARSISDVVQRLGERLD